MSIFLCRFPLKIAKLKIHLKELNVVWSDNIVMKNVASEIGKRMRWSLYGQGASVYFM